MTRRNYFPNHPSGAGCSLTPAYCADEDLRSAVELVSQLRKSKVGQQTRLAFEPAVEPRKGSVPTSTWPGAAIQENSCGVHPVISSVA
jgi:hypothetical protein